jgi:YVTN family beta-propeller protein
MSIVGPIRGAIEMAPEGRSDQPARQLSPDVAFIDVSATPHSVAVSHDGSRLYVSHFLSGAVSVIDTSTNSLVATITSLPAGTYGVAASADGKFLYVANPNSTFVKRVAADGSSSADEIHAGVGAFCYGLAMSPQGRVLYAACALDDKILLLDGLVKNVGEFTGIDFPVAVAVSPDGATLYASNYFSESVSVIDAGGGGSVVEKIKVPIGPYGIAASPDGSHVYVAHFPAGDLISVIDAKSLEVVDSIATGRGPVRGIAASPDGSRLYATNYFASSVSVISIR